MIAVLAPPASSIWRWVTELAEPTTADLSAAELIVVAVDDLAAAARPTVPTIACLPVEHTDWHVAEGAERYAGLRADAYASCHRSLAAALAYLRAEDRTGRTTGPLRLTCLGGLGMLQPEPVSGASFPITGGRTTIGRSPSNTVPIPQGHSDQSNVARIHAIIERTGAGITVRDAASTNGTFVRGQRVDVALLEVGDEIAICGVFRFRLDGLP
jgi:FHA domain